MGQLLLSYKNGSTGTVNAYLAVNSEEAEEGLMYVPSMGSCNGAGSCYGMLFIFQNYSNRCFWMKNTAMPLRQFWITNGTISAEYNATPYSTNVICHYGDEVLETYTNSILTTGNQVYLQNSPNK
ncbi:MAG TPA: DUF192 domain-containing protein [Candidatus Saccharimonadales bacterium]|nr:DUF192 domain-containing protein [Candidatus Saccharimonadales bacterium]